MKPKPMQDHARFQWQPRPVATWLLRAARRLRGDMTDTEKMLWKHLRRKNLDGYRFRRQHPLDRYVLDFYCPALKLAVELDGSQHNTKEGRTSDNERTAWLQGQGIRVLRFQNTDVVTNIDSVIKEIQCKMSER